MSTRAPLALDALASARPTARSTLRSAGAAVLAVMGAEVVRILLEPILNDRLPYVTFYPAVAAAAWAGGLGAGLLATFVTLALVAVPGIPPADTTGAYGVAGFVLFAIGGTLISALGGNLHAARERAEQGAARADFLAAASAILARRLDPLGTMEALARVAVPAFADWCAIDLMDEDGTFDAVRIAHVDPEKVALGYRLRREHPLEPDAPSGPPAVVRSGEPEFMPSIAHDYAAVVEDPARRDILERLDLYSYICVPLAVRGRPLGALTVIMSESRRRFTPEDLATARDLASRAAVAIDHARLYRRVRARGEELDRVIASMEEGVIVADAHGRARSHNPALERILGTTPRDIDGVLASLVPAGEVMRVPATGRAVRVVRSDEDGDEEGSRILILRDVTEVLESRAARDTFVGMLSHEIRTPITTIFGTSQVLLRPLDEELRTELTRDLASETDRLYRLVEDLLVLSRYEREALDLVPEPVLIQRLIPNVAATERGRWPGVTIDLDVEPDLPPVVADPTYVEQVIRNLVSNGAKYGGSRTKIRLVARADPDGVTVEVADSGPGIPAGAEETIFHLYERLPDARQSGAPGAGIGLFVCRRLVELMGGRIWARNGEGGGAVLAFSLPRYGEALLPVQPARPGLAAVASDAGPAVVTADLAPRDALGPAEPTPPVRPDHYPPPAFPQVDDPVPSPAT